jgi:hypothetical protein
MKTQNYRLATKAYQAEDKPIWALIVLVIVIVMSMTLYNSAVLFGTTLIETYGLR